MLMKSVREIEQINRRLREMIDKLPTNTFAAVFAALVIGASGAYLLQSSRAATPAPAIQAEKGTLSANASAVNDTTASNGLAVKFGAGLPALGAATYSATSGIHLGWSDFQTQMQGDLKARRSYDTSIPSSFAASAAAQDVVNNDVSIWSVKLDPGAFSSGSMDTAFNNFLNSIPAGHKTYLTYWHEPEDDIQKGTVMGSTALTLANWQACVNHMGQLIHAKNRPELRNSIILQGMWTYYSGGYGGTEYWGAGFDANVDDVGEDIYANGVDTNGFTKYTPMANKLGYTEMMNWLNLHVISKGKSWGMPEIGAHEEHPASATGAQIAAEDQQKAQWITDSWTWAKANHLAYYIYFNYNATAGLPDDQSNIILAGSPSETAFRAMVNETN